MIDREIVVTIAGNPKTKGSMKCVGQNGHHQLVESHKSVGPWRATVLRVLRKVKTHGVKGQPIVVEATSTLKRPAYHYGTGRNAGIIKDRYLIVQPVEHGTGDVDKLARVYLDVLQQAKVLHDDCQVVELTTRKVYVDSKRPDALTYPGMLLRVTPLEDPC